MPPASHHQLTTGTSKKPSQLGRDHPKWPYQAILCLFSHCLPEQDTHAPPLCASTQAWLAKGSMAAAPALLQEINLHRRGEQRPHEELQPRTWKREGSPPESGLNYPLADYPVCCLTMQQVQKHLSCFHQI